MADITADFQKINLSGLPKHVEVVFPDHCRREAGKISYACISPTDDAVGLFFWEFMLADPDDSPKESQRRYNQEYVTGIVGSALSGLF